MEEEKISLKERVEQLEEEDSIEKKIARLMESLFVNRSDVYATAFLDNKNNRMGYKKTEEKINLLKIRQHIQGKKTLGCYQLKDNKVKWGCCDFDLNTKEDFESAMKLYNYARKEKFNPLFEMSGGGEYKCHVWFFGESTARDMKQFLENLCKRAEVSPHEIFPKQEEQTKTLPYGNLVKLPLGYHLSSKKYSHFLNNEFKPLVVLEDIEELLQFHIDNQDKIPKYKVQEEIKEEITSEPIKLSDIKPTEYDSFFNYTLNNQLPAGISAETKKYPKIEGINSNILKNQAIWFNQKGYTLAQLIKEVKPIFDSRGWSFNDLKGWFKKAQKGDISQINVGELAEWCRTYNIELLKELPDNRIKDFLLEDRTKYESLGCGYHNNVFYFGTRLFKDGRGYTSIITSDKQVYINKEIVIKKQGYSIIGNNEIRTKFGLKYKDDFYDESLDNILSKEVVDKWLFGNCEDITFSSVNEKLKKMFKQFVYLEDKRKYTVLSCYRIAGYFMSIWRAIARLFLLAEFGSAKSRLTQIMHNTGFNSVSLGDWTLAYLKSIIENTRGETHIDDFEGLDEEKKNATIRLVKVGFMKGFKAGKMSDSGLRKPIVNDLFNLTTLNNTIGLDFITADRGLTIRIPKISKKEYDQEPDFQKPIWKELRDELYICGLKYPHKVKETYDNLTSDKIRGRLFLIIKPILTIAKLISEETYQEVESFWEEEINQSDTVDYESDWEFLFLLELYKHLSPLSPPPPLSPLSPLSPPKDFEFKIEDNINRIQSLYSEEQYDKKKRSINIVLGKFLKRNPIFKFKILTGKRIYRVKPEEFTSLLDAKKLLSPILDILQGEMGDSGESGESGAKEIGNTPKKPKFKKKQPSEEDLMSGNVEIED